MCKTSIYIIYPFFLNVLKNWSFKWKQFPHKGMCQTWRFALNTFCFHQIFLVDHSNIFKAPTCSIRLTALRFILIVICTCISNGLQVSLFVGDKPVTQRSLVWARHVHLMMFFCVARQDDLSWICLTRFDGLMSYLGVINNRLAQQNMR